MRITNQLLVNTFLNDLSTIQNNVLKSQRAIETGKEVEDSSDDPARAHRVMRLTDEISRREQYLENISDAVANLNYAQSELMSAQDLLSEARSLAVQGAHDSINEEDRLYLSERVNQIALELVAVANARHENSYIFGGYNTQEAPYQIITDPATGELIGVQDLPTGMDGEITHTIEEGIRIPVNIRGVDVFQTGNPGAAGDLFQVLIDLRDGLINNDSDAIGATIDQIDEGYEKVNEAVTRLGGYVSRLKNTENKLESHNVSAGEHLSKAQDADLAEWITRYQLQQVALTAAMELGGKILPMSLVNYI